jgi:hypothetical protein
MHYDILDNGEYEGIYTVKVECIISDYKVTGPPGAGKTTLNK